MYYIRFADGKNAAVSGGVQIFHATYFLLMVVMWFTLPRKRNSDHHLL
ncbi:MAG: hypothetical protein WBA16_11860 [Nonlabens sp.]